MPGKNGAIAKYSESASVTPRQVIWQGPGGRELEQAEGPSSYLVRAQRARENI